LRALFKGLGVDAQTAATVADSITDWHSPSDIALPMGGKAPRYRSEGRRYGPPGQPLETLDELRLVRGMTPALFERVQPYLSLHLEQMPKRTLAAPVVAAALDDAMRTDKVPVVEPDARGPSVIRIVAVARGAGGGIFTRRAVVRLDGSLIGAPWRYRFLAWGSGADGADLPF
jgi:general secretion pathway protein K